MKTTSPTGRLWRSLLGRPTIPAVIASELYANQRLLIDVEAKADHAQMVAHQHRVAAEAQRATVTRLQAQQSGVQP